ncbi:hypothetical protein [Schlesneria sp. T3-172]|uniref:hypothetical protein n=1 Tax=Schlesneria sphaerica TaxID=3373610 RepID=UPI0037CA09A4
MNPLRDARHRLKSHLNVVRLLTAAVLGLAVAGTAPNLLASPPSIVVDTPMHPPYWALLERELLRQNASACREFFDKYFDERGWLLCVERWGGDDGPDDAIESCLDWPLVHALGGDDDVLAMYKKAWEGHLRQYTLAKTVDVPLARDGMYFKEFPVMMDWLHNSEGLVVFNLQGLSDPQDPAFLQRVKRYAGFYLNEDPGAPNYDADHKIIRSMFNGSRGPLLRKTTGLDWAGDPIEVENRFRPKHGESTYAQMLEHFKDYNDTVGDHPQNLKATTLALNAYLVTQDRKYREWLLEYVDAWHDRMKENGDLIPTNVGLDGRIGSDAGGHWWGGVYGWGFTVYDPASKTMASRNQHHAGLQGFLNAYLLTGDDRYLERWRRQIDAVNRNAKVEAGVTLYPRMYGQEGWYDYVPEKYSAGAYEIAYLSMKEQDLARVSDHAWFRFLNGTNPDYPQQALLADLTRIRNQVDGIRNDPTTPDTRLADDPLPLNPASVNSLVELMLGGLPPGRSGSALFCRLRYFDPEKRRAGLPDGVAALVDEMSDSHVTVTLVNVDQQFSRDVTVQAGAYAEHHFESVTNGSKVEKVDRSSFTVQLAPGAGAKLRIQMNCFSNPPRMSFPWR